MKVLNGLLCVSAAVLALAICGCEKASKSGSSGSDDSRSSESSAFTGKFSPKVHEDAEIAIGLNLDQQKLVKIGESFFDQVSAMAEDADDKKMIAERKEKFKVFVKEPFENKDLIRQAIKGNESFFEVVATRLRKAKIGWAVVSAEGIESEDGHTESKTTPEIALAVATDIDMEEIVAHAKQKAGEGVRRNFVLEECTVADEKAWRIVPQEKRHRLKLEIMNIEPCFTALDGGLFLIASNRSALKKQIRLYRKGQGQGRLLGEFKPAHGDLFRFAAKDLGRVLNSVPSRKLDNLVPRILPRDLLRQFKGVNLSLTAKSGSTVALALRLHTMSAENAADLRAMAKRGMEAFCSRLPETRADTIKRMKIAGTGDVFEVEVNDLLPVLAIIVAPSSSTNPSGKHVSTTVESVKCARNLRALAQAAALE